MNHCTGIDADFSACSGLGPAELLIGLIIYWPDGVKVPKPCFSFIRSSFLCMCLIFVQGGPKNGLFSVVNNFGKN